MKLLIKLVIEVFSTRFIIHQHMCQEYFN